MAKENTVQLYGRVIQEPVRRMDTEGNYLSCKILLTTLRRTYATKELLLRGVPRWDTLCVLSRNAHLIKHQMADIKEGDMILIKGSLVTQEIIKRFICTECGEITKRQGVVIYVDPIFVKQCETGLPETKAYEMVQNAIEISNQIRIMGTLCREPELYNEEVENGKQRTECTFQIASNRNRHILEDNPEKRTDYPWVRAFGPTALEYYNALHINSSVYIDGAIQVRTDIQREIVCDECGALFTRPDTATEIIPYNIEYLKNCDIPESEREEEFEYAE